MLNPIDFFKDSISQFRKKFSNQIENFDIENPSPYLTGIDTQLQEDILEILRKAAEVIGIEDFKLKESLTSKGINYSDDINGYTSSSDQWKTFTIYLNVGLMSFIEEFAIIYSSRISPSGNMTVDESAKWHVEWSETSEYANALLNNYFSIDNNSSTTKTKLTLDFMVKNFSNEQLRISSRFSDEMKRFVIAHEFGHIILKKSNKMQKTKKGFTKLHKRAIDTDDKLKAFEKKQIAEKWGEESACDFLGTILLLKFSNNNFHAQQLTASSIEMFFQSLAIMEIYSAMILKREIPINSHPPSLIRLTILRNSIPDLFKSTKIGSAFEYISGLLIEDIEKRM